MGRKPTGRPSRRTPIPIDWKLVEKMTLAGSSGTEIAAALDIDNDTFYRRFKQEKGTAFAEYSPRRKPGGHALLRLKQFESAMRGNTQMLKLLGEEWLGQGKKVFNDDYSFYRNLIQEREMETRNSSGQSSESPLEDQQPLSH